MLKYIPDKDQKTLLHDYRPDKFEGQPLPIVAIQSLPISASQVVVSACILFSYSLLKELPDASAYAYAVAGYAAASVVRDTLIAVLEGTFTSGLVLVAHRYGEGDSRGVWQVALHVILLNLVLSIAFAVAGMAVAGPVLGFCAGGAEAADLAKGPFTVFMATFPFYTMSMTMGLLFRGVGDVRYPTGINVLAGLAFCLLAWFLIPMFSVAGLALALVAGAALMTTTAYWAVIFSGRSSIRVCRDVPFSATLLREIVRLAWPISLKTVVSQVGFVFVFASLSSYGAVVVAAWQASKDIINFGASIGGGVRSAASSMVSARTAARAGRSGDVGLVADLRACVMAILRFTLACSAAVDIALVLMREAVSSFLSPDAGVSELIAIMSLVYAATILFRNVDFALSGVLNGLKLTKVTGLVSVASAVLAYWLIPALAMALKADYLVVVSCMGAFHLVCVFAYAFVLARMLRTERLPEVANDRS